jgi:zinc protease
MINSLAGEFETNSDAVGNLANIFIYGLPLDYYSHYAEQVAAVTPEQALAMAKKYLGQDRLIVVVVGDRAKIEPQIRKLNLGSIAVVKADAVPVTATR